VGDGAKRVTVVIGGSPDPAPVSQGGAIVQFGPSTAGGKAALPAAGSSCGGTLPSAAHQCAGAPAGAARKLIPASAPPAREEADDEPFLP